MDYRLEEINKKIKNSLFTDDPTYNDWVKAMSKASKLESMVDRAKEDYNITSNAVEPNAPTTVAKLKFAVAKFNKLNF